MLTLNPKFLQLFLTEKLENFDLEKLEKSKT